MSREVSDDEVESMLAELATFHRYGSMHYQAIARLLGRIDSLKARAKLWKLLAKSKVRALESAQPARSQGVPPRDGKVWAAYRACRSDCKYHDMPGVRGHFGDCEPARSQEPQGGTASDEQVRYDALPAWVKERVDSWIKAGRKTTAPIQEPPRGVDRKLAEGWKRINAGVWAGCGRCNERGVYLCDLPPLIRSTCEAHAESMGVFASPAGAPESVTTHPNLSAAIEGLYTQRHAVLDRESSNATRPDDAWCIAQLEHAIDVLEMAEAHRMNPSQEQSPPPPAPPLDEWDIFWTNAPMGPPDPPAGAPTIDHPFEGGPVMGNHCRTCGNHRDEHLMAPGPPPAPSRPEPPGGEMAVRSKSEALNALEAISLFALQVAAERPSTPENKARYSELTDAKMIALRFISERSDVEAALRGDLAYVKDECAERVAVVEQSLRQMDELYDKARAEAEKANALMEDMRKTRGDQHHEIDVLRGELEDARAEVERMKMSTNLNPTPAKPGHYVESLQNENRVLRAEVKRLRAASATNRELADRWLANTTQFVGQHERDSLVELLDTVSRDAHARGVASGKASMAEELAKLVTFQPTGDDDVTACAKCHNMVGVRDGSEWEDGDICDSCAHDALDSIRKIAELAGGKDSP